MRNLHWLVVLAGMVAMSSPAAQAASSARVRITWQEDISKAIKQARSKDVPILLYVRDIFGEKFIDYVEARHDWDEESLRRHLRRSEARWRWQRIEEDIFTQKEFAQVVQPFVRVRLETGYRRLRDETRDVLLKLTLLTDVDLAWRWRLVDDPWDETGTFAPFGGVTDRDLNTTLDELLAREATCVAVVAGDGQLLLRYPSGPPGFEAPIKVLITELGNVLTPYRDLYDARRDLEDGRVKEAVEVLKALAEAGKAVPNEVREEAESDLESLLTKANEGLQEVERALARNDFERASRSLTELETQGLHELNPTVTEKSTDFRAQVDRHAQELYRKAQEDLDQGRLLEAFDSLNRLARYFGSTDVGALAKTKLEELNKDPAIAEKLRQARRRSEAEEVLATAQGAEQRDDILEAYRAYKRLSDDYADLPQGAQAEQKLAAWQADAAVMETIRTLEAQSEAAQLMTLGDNYFVNRLYSQAIEYYQQVVDTYPESAVAGDARGKLDEARRLLEAQQKDSDQPAPAVEGSP